MQWHYICSNITPNEIPRIAKNSFIKYMSFFCVHVSFLYVWNLAQQTALSWTNSSASHFHVTFLQHAILHSHIHNTGLPHYHEEFLTRNLNSVVLKTLFHIMSCLSAVRKLRRSADGLPAQRWGHRRDTAESRCNDKLSIQYNDSKSRNKH
jgi:hypothetical protein